MTARPDKKPTGFKHFQRRPKSAAPAEPRSNPDELLIFGLHAAEAALLNPARRVRAAQATENAARKLEAAFREKGLEPEKTSPRNLDKRLGSDTVHQGVVLEVEPLAEPSLEDLAEAAAADGRPLIVLDQVTDPHNVGAVLRSAAVFGCAGLITTRRHSPPLGGVLAKSASGGLEHVPVHLAQNLARALTALKEAGVAVYGLEGTASEALHDALPASGGLAIVLGAEGKGLRQLTAETCDRLCRIETKGALASLNVSNAAAIALHLIAIRKAG